MNNVVVSIIGFLILIRILHSITIISFHSNKEIIIRIIKLAFLVIIILFIHLKTFQLWILIGIILITLNIFSKIIHFVLQNQLNLHCAEIVTEAILNISMGHSIKKSIFQYIERQNIYQRVMLRSIAQSLYISDEDRIKISNLEISFTIQQMIKIEKSENKTFEQLQTLREQIEKEKKFRHKSRQIKYQPLIQLFTISILYIFLLIYEIASNKWSKINGILSLSLILFLAGLVLMKLITRSPKWSI